GPTSAPGCPERTDRIAVRCQPVESCTRVARNVVVARRLRPVLVSRYSYTPLTKTSADPPARISRLMLRSALSSLTDAKNWLNVACSVVVRPGYTRRI